MAIHFGADDIPETLEGFGDRAGPGNFHFLVTGLDEGEGDAAMVVEMEVLAGNPISEVGKTHREYFNKPTADQTQEKRQNTVKRFNLFAVATGLATEDEIIAGRENGRGCTIDYCLAIGRQLCGIITVNEKSAKKYRQLGYDIFACNSEKAKGIPLSQEKLGEQGTAAAVASADPFGNFF